MTWRISLMLPVMIILACFGLLFAMLKAADRINDWAYGTHNG